MKKCINCGADFDSDLLNCPYCGYENVEAAQEAYHDKIEELVEAREEIHELPQKVTKKRTKIVAVVLVLLMVAAFLTAGVLAIKTKLQMRDEIKSEQENKQVMEEYLAKGDYKGLYNYLQDVEYSYTAYGKYIEVVDVYYRYEWFEGQIDFKDEYFWKVTDDIKFDIIRDLLSDFNDVYVHADEQLNNNERYGNDKHIEAICDMAKTRFMEEVPVDEKMVERIISQADGESYDKIAEEILKAVLEEDK